MNDGTKYRLVSEIVKRYQNLMKSRSSKSDSAKAKRKAFSPFGVTNLRVKLFSERVRT